MKVLAFFAHPDDETMLAGGTLALLARLGADVHYLCATRGEGGEAGDPPLCAPPELGTLRAAELACAVQALGGASLRFLPYVDPSVGPDNTLYAFMDDPVHLAEELRQVLEELSADVLITHGSSGEYGHPAHRLIYAAAHRTAQTWAGPQRLWYTVQAAYADAPKPRLLNPDDPAHWVLDVTPLKAEKTAATLCHRTQHALFVRNTSKQLGRPVSVPEVVVTLESLYRAAPPAEDGQPQDALGLLLRRAGRVREEAAAHG